jgi:hypothetical protein
MPSILFPPLSLPFSLSLSLSQPFLIPPTLSHFPLPQPSTRIYSPVSPTCSRRSVFFPGFPEPASETLLPPRFPPRIIIPPLCLASISLVRQIHQFLLFSRSLTLWSLASHFALTLSLDLSSHCDRCVALAYKRVPWPLPLDWFGFTHVLRLRQIDKQKNISYFVLFDNR